MLRQGPQDTDLSKEQVFQDKSAPDNSTPPDILNELLTLPLETLRSSLPGCSGKSLLWVAACAAAGAEGPAVFNAIWEKHKDHITLIDLRAQALEGLDKGISVLWLLACAAMNGKPAAFISVWKKFKDQLTVEDFRNEALAGVSKGISVSSLLANAANKGNLDLFEFEDSQVVCASRIVLMRLILQEQLKLREAEQLGNSCIAESEIIKARLNKLMEKLYKFLPSMEEQPPASVDTHSLYDGNVLIFTQSLNAIGSPSQPTTTSSGDPSPFTSSPKFPT